MKSERDKIAEALNAIKFKSTENRTQWRSQIFCQECQSENEENCFVLPRLIVVLADSIGFGALNFDISSF